MESSLPLRRVPDLRNATFNRTPAGEGDALLGRDAGRDSALHYAAIAIFGVTGAAVLALTAGLYVFATRDGDWLLREGAESAAFLSGTIGLDAPILRPGLDSSGGEGVTLFDEATGRHDVLARPLEAEPASVQSPGVDPVSLGLR